MRQPRKPISEKEKKKLAAKLGWLTAAVVILGSSLFVPLGVKGSNRTLLIVLGVAFGISYLILAFVIFGKWWTEIYPRKPKIGSANQPSQYATIKGDVKSQDKDNSSSDWNW